MWKFDIDAPIRFALALIDDVQVFAQRAVDFCGGMLRHMQLLSNQRRSGQ